MWNIADSRISEILSSVGVPADQALVSGIRSYIAILLQWNRKFSLTSIEDPEEIVRVHFAESLFASTLVSMQYGRLADVGSGAGFPGVPIKMLAPELHLSLIESNTKKATFLGEVARKLSLAPVQVLNRRIEDLSAEKLTFDFITARAVGDHLGVLNWARRHLSASGKAVLFLGSEGAAEVTGVPEWNWIETLIPESKRRVVLVGTPT